MEVNNIEILKKIKRVETHPDMYEKIVRRIQQRKNQVVPIYQVGIAALLVLGMLVCDVVMINHHKNQNINQNGLEQMFAENNNNLYNE